MLIHNLECHKFFHRPTFKPLEQLGGDNKMYNGPGYMPCNGWVRWLS